MLRVSRPTLNWHDIPPSFKSVLTLCTLLTEMTKVWFTFIRLFIFMYMSFVLSYMCVPHASLVPGGQKRVSGPPGLALPTLVSWHVRAGSQTWVLWASGALSHWVLSLPWVQCLSLRTGVHSGLSRWQSVTCRLKAKLSTLKIENCILKVKDRLWCFCSLDT